MSDADASSGRVREEEKNAVARRSERLPALPFQLRLPERRRRVVYEPYKFDRAPLLQPPPPLPTPSPPPAGQPSSSSPSSSPSTSATATTTASTAQATGMSAASTAAHAVPASAAAPRGTLDEHAEDNGGNDGDGYAGRGGVYGVQQGFGQAARILYEAEGEQEGLWKQERAGGAGSGAQAAGMVGGAGQAYEGYPAQSAAVSNPSHASTSASSSSYAHPLYSRMNAPPSASSSAYSHPAYTSSSSTTNPAGGQPGSSTGYAPYQPYGQLPSAHRASFDASYLRPPSAGGSGGMGTQLPPMSLALGGPSTLAARRESLPSLAASYPPPSLSTSSYSHPHYAQQQQQQQDPSTEYLASYQSSSSSSAAHHLAPPPFLSHTHNTSSALSHPAYSRPPSLSSYPSNPSSGGSPTSFTSLSTAATAASALSSLSAAANAAASGSTSSFTSSSIPKPSTSSSVPNSPWAGPPPPSQLSLGVAGLAKRRRSATDAVLGLPSSSGTGGGAGEEGRRMSFGGLGVGELSAVRKMRTASGEMVVEEEEGAEEEQEAGGEGISHFSQPPPEHPHQQQQQQRDGGRRGSDASTISLSHSYPQSHLNRSAPSSTDPSPRLVHQPPPPRYALSSHASHQQQSQRTYTLANSDGSTTTVKEPRASSPMQPHFPPPAPAPAPPHHSLSLSHPAYSHPSYAQPLPPPPHQPLHLRPLQPPFLPPQPHTAAAAAANGYRPIAPALPPLAVASLSDHHSAAGSNSPSPASASSGGGQPVARQPLPTAPVPPLARTGTRGKKRKSVADEEDEGEGDDGVEGEEAEEREDDGQDEDDASKGRRTGKRRGSVAASGVAGEKKGKGGGKRGKEGEKKFVCPHPSCGRAFARNFNLQSHIKSHQGIREFKCPECDKLFSRKHDCTRHCIAIHGYDKDFMAKATSTASALDTTVAVGPIHVPQEVLPMGEYARKVREERERRELSSSGGGGGGSGYRVPSSSSSSAAAAPFLPAHPPPPQQPPSTSSLAMASVAAAAVESATAVAAAGAEAVTVPLRRASLPTNTFPSSSAPSAFAPPPPPINLRQPPPPRNARANAQVASGLVGEAGGSSPEQGAQGEGQSAFAAVGKGGGAVVAAAAGA